MKTRKIKTLFYQKIKKQIINTLLLKAPKLILRQWFEAYIFLLLSSSQNCVTYKCSTNLSLICFPIGATFKTFHNGTIISSRGLGGGIWTAVLCIWPVALQLGKDNLSIWEKNNNIWSRISGYMSYSGAKQLIAPKLGPPKKSTN